jgi:hypothetical protein
MPGQAKPCQACQQLSPQPPPQPPQPPQPPPWQQRPPLPQLTDAQQLQQLEQAAAAATVITLSEPGPALDALASHMAVCAEVAVNIKVDQEGAAMLLQVRVVEGVLQALIK